MFVVWSIITGLAVGSFVSWFETSGYHTEEKRTGEHITVSLVGALIGGVLARFVSGTMPLTATFTTIVFAVGGSTLLLAFVRAYRKRRSR